jgi:phage-related protein
MYKIEFYETDRGDKPALDFIKELPKDVIGKLTIRLELLEQRGTLLRRPYADKLRGKIYELRASFGHLEIRLLYFYHGRVIVVTHGFLKKTNAVPEDEIRRAESHMNNYEGR